VQPVVPPAFHCNHLCPLHSSGGRPESYGDNFRKLVCSREECIAPRGIGGKRHIRVCVDRTLVDELVDQLFDGLIGGMKNKSESVTLVLRENGVAEDRHSDGVLAVERNLAGKWREREKG
jgi:hypothetical protein